MNELIEIEGVGTAIATPEQNQDLEIQKRMNKIIRTSDISEEEAVYWKDIVFGRSLPQPSEYIDGEAKIWREILEQNGPAHRSPILTDDITEEEIVSWKEAEEQIKNMDLDALRNKIEFESEVIDAN